jgi:hypothetical protein
VQSAVDHNSTGAVLLTVACALTKGVQVIVKEIRCRVPCAVCRFVPVLFTIRYSRHPAAIVANAVRNYESTPAPACVVRRLLLACARGWRQSAYSGVIPDRRKGGIGMSEPARPLTRAVRAEIDGRMGRITSIFG